jgi:hypothetical protein
MAIYITGLVLITGAVELLLALLVASRTSVPSASSLFWPAYLAVLIALVVAGAILIARGLEVLHRDRAPAETAAE